MVVQAAWVTPSVAEALLLAMAERPVREDRSKLEPPLLLEFRARPRQGFGRSQT